MRHLTPGKILQQLNIKYLESFYFKSNCVFVQLTFVFQPESSCRYTDIREKVEVELVGGTVEESWDGCAFRGRRLIVKFWNAILHRSPITNSIWHTTVKQLQTHCH